MKILMGLVGALVIGSNPGWTQTNDWKLPPGTVAVTNAAKIFQPTPAPAYKINLSQDYSIEVKGTFPRPVFEISSHPVYKQRMLHIKDFENLCNLLLRASDTSKHLDSSNNLFTSVTFSHLGPKYTVEKDGNITNIGQLDQHGSREPGTIKIHASDKGNGRYQLWVEQMDAQEWIFTVDREGFIYDIFSDVEGWIPSSSLFYKLLYRVGLGDEYRRGDLGDKVKNLDFNLALDPTSSEGKRIANTIKGYLPSVEHGNQNLLYSILSRLNMELRNGWPQDTKNVNLMTTYFGGGAI